VAALLVALLLLAGGLVLARRDNGGARLSTGASTSSSVLDSFGPATDPSTSVVDTLSSIDPVNTPSPTTATGSGTGTGTGAPGSTPPGTAGPGVLEPAVATVALPRTDATAGASAAPLTLRNTGASDLTYGTQSSSLGLSASPARGTIAPGASVDVTVTLDASRLAIEGPFTGTLTFDGTGGAKSVQVQSTVGRPPEILDSAGQACAPSPTCSRQITLEPSSTPNPTICNTPWAYSVVIRDMSQIQSARVIARFGTANADTPLIRKTPEVFASNVFGPLPGGVVLRFAMEAVDQFGFGRRLPEQSVVCPP